MVHRVLWVGSSRNLAKATTQLSGSQADVQEGPCALRALMQKPIPKHVWESVSVRRSLEKGSFQGASHRKVSLLSSGALGMSRELGPGWRRHLVEGLAQWTWVRHGS